MNKLLVFITMIFILVGCSSKEDVIVTINNNETISTVVVEDGIFYYSNLEKLEVNEDFLYWYYLENNSEVKVTDNVEVSSNITIIAKYQIVKYNVVISNNGNESVVQITKNTKLDFDILQNQNTSENFLYWYYLISDNEVIVDKDITITSNITIIAKYEGEATKYNVTINNKTQQQIVQVEAFKTFNYSILESQNTGDNFLYWYYLENGNEVKVESNLVITKSITIIAKYDETIMFSVTIKNQTNEEIVLVEENNIFTMEKLNEQEVGDTFLYWYYLENGNEVIVDEDITITSNITIIAKYESSTGTLPWV